VFLPSDVYKAKPQTLSINEPSVGQNIRENSADAQAAEWLEWGKEHANPRLYQIAPFEGVLIALLDYAKSEV